MSRLSQPMRSRSRESEVREETPSPEEETSKRLHRRSRPRPSTGRGIRKEEERRRRGTTPEKGFGSEGNKKRNAVDLRERSPTPHPSGVRRVSIERK